MMLAEYITAFTTGLLGGLGHCLGMCGPVVGSYAISSSHSIPSSHRLLSHILYNTGRISTYSAVGSMMGLLGSVAGETLRSSGIQRGVVLMAGILMVIMGLGISGVIGRPSWLERMGNPIIRIVRAFIVETSIFRYFILGAILGLMPCGLSYSMFVASAGTGSPLRGLLLCLSFGLGTVPALFFLGYSASLVGAGLRGLLYRASGALIVLMGILYIKKVL